MALEVVINLDRLLSILLIIPSLSDRREHLSSAVSSGTPHVPCEELL